MRILGLDEAGRGCVLGPLVVGGFLLSEGELQALRETGVTDSKRLSPRRREALVPVLTELGQHELVEISPAAIDAGNLNRLEEDAFLQLIQHLQPDRVILDAPCHPRGIPKLQARLSAQAPGVSEWVIEPKADLNYAPCGAASVLAKVRRDEHITPLGVGSGYPSDPKTRAWLRGFLDRNEPFPDCVRTRWGTIQTLRQGSLFPGLES